MVFTLPVNSWSSSFLTLFCLSIQSLADVMVPSFLGTSSSTSMSPDFVCCLRLNSSSILAMSSMRSRKVPPVFSLRIFSLLTKGLSLVRLPDVFAVVEEDHRLRALVFPEESFVPLVIELAIRFPVLFEARDVKSSGENGPPGCLSRSRSSLSPRRGDEKAGSAPGARDSWAKTGPIHKDAIKCNKSRGNSGQILFHDRFSSLTFFSGPPWLLLRRTGPMISFPFHSLDDPRGSIIPYPEPSLDHADGRLSLVHDEFDRFVVLFVVLALLHSSSSSFSSSISLWYDGRSPVVSGIRRSSLSLPRRRRVRGASGASPHRGS